MTRLYGLIALIVAGVLAIVFIIGGAFISSLSDDTNNTDPAIIEKNISLEDAIHHHIVAALKSAGEGRVELRLDGYDVNELLYALGKKLGADIGLKSIYIENDGDVYRLCAPMTLLGVDSLISGEVDLYNEGDTFFAEVKGLRVGSHGINSPLVSMLGVKGKITKALNENGIPAYFTADALKIQMSKNDIGVFISDVLKENSNAGLVNAIYSLLMIKEKAVDINITSPTDISVAVDLGIFEGQRNDRLDRVNGFSEALLQGGVIGLGDVELVGKYYLNGYDRLSDEDKAKINECLSSAILPEDISAHSGIIEREKVSLLSILLTQLELNTDYLLPGFKISDSDISAMLSDIPLVGMVWQYGSYRDGSCAFVAIQSFYCSIGDDLIELYLDVNLNGYLVTVRADFISEESPLASTGGQLDKAYLGNVELGEYEIDQLFAFLSEKLEVDWIAIDAEVKTLTLDFTSTFEGNNLLVAILKGSKNIVTVCRSRGILDGGYVLITFSLF